MVTFVFYYVLFCVCLLYWIVLFLQSSHSIDCSGIHGSFFVIILWPFFAYFSVTITIYNTSPYVFLLGFLSSISMKKGQIDGLFVC